MWSKRTLLWVPACIREYLVSLQIAVILQLWKYFYGCYDLGCARNMKMLRANGGGVGRFRV